MIESPLAFGLLAMVSWGVWAVVAEIATESVSPEVAMIVSYVTGAAIALGYVLTQPDAVEYSTRGLGVAALAGVFAGIGAVAFYAGLAGGNTSVVTTVSALYFVVAAVIAVLFLDDPVTLRTVAGVGTAALAVWLLAG